MIIDMSHNNNMELMAVVRQYAEQRDVDYATVISAIEEAIRVFEANKYKYDKIVVKVDQNTGRTTAFKELLVMDGERSSGAFIDGYQCINLAGARKLKADAVEGDIVYEALPAVSLRDSARNAFFSKNALRTKLAEIIRDKHYNLFKGLVGEIVAGIVKRVDVKTLTVDVQGIENIVPTSSLIRGELFRKGDRIKAYLSSVSKDGEGVYLGLSRVHPQFVVQLFKQEVPEIYDGVVQVKSVARAPGAKTKIAVSSSEGGIDPVGACVGMKGVRVRAVIDELRGEKIDIVEYSSDPATFVVNALSSVEAVKVILDEEGGRMEVVVPENQLSIAIGKKGQNVGLISVLVGWKIDILSEKDESNRRAEELEIGTRLFMDALDVEKMMAQLLVMEGYSSINSIANANVYELSSIEGFDKVLAEELISRAKHYLSQNEDVAFKDKEVSKDSKIVFLPSILPIVLLRLSSEGIETVGELADLSRDELKDILYKDGLDYEGLAEISNEYLDGLIMLAREKSGWFN